MEKKTTNAGNWSGKQLSYTVLKGGNLRVYDMEFAVREHGEGFSYSHEGRVAVKAFRSGNLWVAYDPDTGLDRVAETREDAVVRVIANIY